MIYNDLTNIKNAYLAKHIEVTLPYSRLTHGVAEVLHARGYVGEVRIDKNDKEGESKRIVVHLRYTEGVGHLHEVIFMSKPGRRIYARVRSMRKVRQGFGDLIVSTPQGIMTGSEARKKGLGGEVICEVF